MLLDYGGSDGFEEWGVRIVEPSNPAISITKTGDTLSKIGDSVDYHFEICNTGDVPLNRSSVTDDKLGDLTARFPETLAIGECVTVDYLDFIIPADAADPFINTVTAVYESATTNVNVQATDSHETNLFQPAIDITKTGDELSKAGDDVTYTITVYNNSSSDTPEMTFRVVDAMLGLDESVVIANGATKVYTIPYTIPADFAEDDLVNTVTVVTSFADFDNVYRDSATWSIELFQPAITLTKVGNKTEALAGEWVHYTITVTNTSSADTPNLIGDVNDSWYGYLGTVNMAPGDVVVYEYDRQMPTWADPEHPSIIHNDAWVDASPEGFPNVIHAEDDWDVRVIYYHDETAWALGGSNVNEILRFTTLNTLKSTNWGWTNNIGTGDYSSEIDEWELWAGAAQEDTTKGTLVGTVAVRRVGTTVTITYHTNGPGMHDLLGTHLWVGTSPLPMKKGVYINDPGQLENKKVAEFKFTKTRIDEDTIVYVFTNVPTDADIWIAAHADVRVYYE